MWFVLLWLLISLPGAPQGGAQAQAAPATPAGTARISGRVTRLDNDKPIAGAVLQLQRVGGAPQDPRTGQFTARTDAQGAYSFDKLTEGPYLLLADRKSTRLN